MSRERVRIVTPVWPDAPRHVQEWMRQVTVALTGGFDGQDALLGIEEGTRAVNVLVDGRGRLSDVLSVQESNISSGTSSGGAGGNLVATASVTSVFKSASSSVVTSGDVVMTVSGGSAPYSYAWSKKSGDDMALSGPSSLTTNFAATIGNGQDKSAIYCFTVTDNVGASFEICVNVFLRRSISSDSGLAP